MPYVLAVMLVVLAAPLSAQTTAQPPLPPIGLPLPPIGLPLPRIGLDPPVSQQPRDTRSDLPSRHWKKHRRSRPAIVIFGAPYPWFDTFTYSSSSYSAVPGMGQDVSPAPPEPQPDTGTLRLEIEPADFVQVYVDDVFVGTLFDLNNELALVPGTRRIELRAPGYEPLAFDVRIEAGRSITYTGKLTPSPATPPPAPEPATPPKPSTFYLIPGCYLGNIPPDQVKLPEGCDLSKLITRTIKQ